ncbi:hypothetical protein SCHPADRAFT_903998 [Schizopora paradoxa]|uniref:Uncharacterized protein n=1 Tax=Schizopora paradoxa TaxID=27342 RepID=A0A0H2RP74_9AGAM|nr:hypothetical protein SCHPADRAFT_903998 [Schizopora paradoxa]
MASWRTSSVSGNGLPKENRRGLPATTRSWANARTTTRKGSITAVVSDTVDRLEERTVPESALLPIDPATYTGAHARRRLVPLGLDWLPPPAPWVSVSLIKEKETRRKHTLTRRK